MKFTQRGCAEGQQYPSDQHLRARTHGFGWRKRQLAGKRRRDRPTDCGYDQGQRACPIYRRVAEVKRGIHEHGHSGYSDEESQAEAKCERLSPQ